MQGRIPENFVIIHFINDNLIHDSLINPAIHTGRGGGGGGLLISFFFQTIQRLPP